MLIVVPPLLLTARTRCDIVPVAIVPKSSEAGLTAMWPADTPVPVTALVEPPPLLLNTTLLLNAPTLVGMKLTCTVPV